MLTQILIALIRLYQRTLSRLILAAVGPVCRFEPSCSHYAVACLQGHVASAIEPRMHALHPDTGFAYHVLLDLAALYLPPVKRSSLKPFLDNPPSAIGIIDGEFYQSLALSTQEILPFLDRGVPVFGSSSMGALRAVGR